MKDEYCQTNSGRLRYWHRGKQGPVLLLIPGLGGNVENWQYNIDVLSQHFQVYVLEPIGFGRSDKPLIQYTIAKLSASIVEFIKLRQFEKLSLIGNSLGGALAMYVADACPTLVDKLVLAGSAGFSRKLPFAFRLASLPILAECLMRPRLSRMQKVLRSFVYDPSTLSDEFIKKMFELASLPGNRRVLLNIIRSHINFWGMKPRLFTREFEKVKQLTQPTLLIWGRHDPVIYYENATIALNTLSHAKLVTFEKCGHLPQIEKADLFNQHVIQFLK